MTQNEVLGIMQDAITTVIKAASPMLIVAIVVGLIVSIFQATTQINDQTLAFVPKIVAVLLSLLLFGGFIITTLQGFMLRLFESINTFVG
ncbi:MAG: flagellar biosynthesis protein FliQ [Oscillospiraceae bacterium]|jgi:flagellar biosynthetic protein FliQ|nr:flagellar biosynthesis protein FliQ [Oscillospiraceae bacterium]